MPDSSNPTAAGKDSPIPSPKLNASENTPLLTNGHAESSKPGEDTETPKKPWRFWRFANPLDVKVISPRYKKVPYLAALIIFLNEFDFFFKHVPTRRMVEQLHCIEYYEAHDPETIRRYGHRIPESLCKNNVVQIKTSETIGIVLFILMACALIGVIPLAHVGVRYSRKWALFMNKLTWVWFTATHLFVYLTYPLLPIKSLYISGIFAIQGGNFDAGMAVLYNSIADVVPAHEDRTSVFFIVSAMLPLAQLTPPISGFLLDLDGQGGTPWVPYIAALISICSSALICITIYPETIHTVVAKGLPVPDAAENGTAHSNGKSQTNNMNGHSSSDGDGKDLGAKSSESKGGFFQSMASFARKTWTAINEPFKGLGLASMIILAFAMFLTVSFRTTIDWQALVQYATIKLEWPLSKASITLTLQAITNLIMLSIVVPFLNRYGASRLGSSTTSIIILFVCSIILPVGNIIVGLSTSTPIFILGMLIYTSGQAFSISLQAYIGNKVDRRQVGRVMALLSLFQTGGKLVSSLVFPKLLELGLNSETEVMVGLPFFVAAAAFALAGLCVGVHVILLKVG